MEIEETSLPGVGLKFKCKIAESEYVVIIQHNTGKREIYLDDDPDQDNKKLLTLTASQAETIGNILADISVDHQPERVYAQLDQNSMIEWYHLSTGSPLLGRTLADINADDQIPVQVIACKEEHHTTTTSHPDHVLEGDEMIIAVGSKEDHSTFKNYIGAS